jgi:hypothetical protein
MTSTIREVRKRVIGLLWYNWCCFRSLSIALDHDFLPISELIVLEKKNRAEPGLLYTYRTSALSALIYSIYVPKIGDVLGR